MTGKFLSLGDSGKADAGSSDEAAGGFGVAKAVILGTSSTFRWELHTRDNLAVSEGANVDVAIYDAPYLQGARITVFDVPERFDVHSAAALARARPAAFRGRRHVGAQPGTGTRDPVRSVHYAPGRAKIRLALVPPNPNEFVIACDIASGAARFSSGHRSVIRASSSSTSSSGC